VILARLPVESPHVIAFRRMILTGTDGQAVRDMAAEILAHLPADPAAAQHRAVLDAEVEAWAEDVAAGDLSAWRTPAEAEWTDGQLRAASSRWHAGDRDEETLRANRAYERVMRRRRRGIRTQPDDGSHPMPAPTAARAS
jgi:hypothetical protein